MSSYQKGFGAYDRGDYDTALKEWRPLAEQGYTIAQNNLVTMYAQGQGVPKDYVLAHMWANLAAAQGDEKAIKKRDFLELMMTPAQLTEAQRLAREWKSNRK